LPLKVRTELFKAPDTWIAEVLGVYRNNVCMFRKRHGIAPATGRGGAPRKGRDEFIKRWTPRINELQMVMEETR
jgi:hypothetical protein